MKIEEDLLLPAAEYNRPAGAQVVSQALDRGLDFDAIFCFNDLLAHGVLRTLLSGGRAVPDDVAMTGVDNIEEDRFSTPSRSSIAPDKAEIARLAVDVLRSRIDGATDQPRQLEVAVSVVARESTAR